MIIFCTIFFAILIFPIYLNVNVFYNKEIKKIFLRVDFFRSIKIVGGYFNFYKEGIAFHVKENKALLFPYNNSLELKNKVKPLKDYHVKKIVFRIDIGSKNQEEISIFLLCFYVWHNAIARGILYNAKPYIEYKNNLNIFEESNRLNTFIEFTTIFNLLMIILSLIKIFLEKTIYANNG